MKESYSNYEFLLISGSAHLVFRFPLPTVYWLEPCGHCRQNPHEDGPRGKTGNRICMAPLSPVCLCQPQSPKANVPNWGNFLLKQKFEGPKANDAMQGKGLTPFNTGGEGWWEGYIELFYYPDVWDDLLDTMGHRYYTVKDSVALLIMHRQWKVLIH